MASFESFHRFEDRKRVAAITELGVTVGITANTIKEWELGYRFETHYHPFTEEFMDALVNGSVAGLQDMDTAVSRDANGRVLTDGDGNTIPVYMREVLTDTDYSPTELVERPLPKERIALRSDAYSVYNWELFYHSIIAICVYLSKAGRYEEAQRWYHYIFDPTDDGDGSTPERFWKFQAFKKTDAKLLEEVFLNLSTREDEALWQDTVNSINAWKKNPFRPHVVARFRPSEYMYYTVMSYLDNLLFWGDSLFRQDTRESINEAAQLYLLGSSILGKRPQRVPSKKRQLPRTYKAIRSELDEFSNVLIGLESEIGGDTLPPPDDDETSPRARMMVASAASLYFCVPRNPKLLGYWDDFADRIFKIRNSLNLQGIFRQLALFDPPIDPALLARASASGLNIADVMAGFNQPVPLVRFRTLLQKATELAQEVRALGQSLQSALRDRDEQRLQLLRSTHEKAMLHLGEMVEYAQVVDAEKSVEAIEQSIENAFQRYRYYQQLLGASDDQIAIPDLSEVDQDALRRMASREREPVVPQEHIEISISESAEGITGGRKLSPTEADDITLLDLSAGARYAAGTIEAVGHIVSIIPQFGAKMQPMGGGADVTFGGRELSAMFNSMASAHRTVADLLAHNAGRAGKLAGYERREQEWRHQSNVLAGEMTMLFKQKKAAEVREAIAKRELEMHRRRMTQAAEIDDFLKEEKVTGLSFVNWMVKESKGLLGQAYDLAYAVAKKAERAMQYELGDPGLSYIGNGHMNGPEGMLAGERLNQDIRSMEMAYHDLNVREHEMMTKVSLRQLDPIALATLRATGRCSFTISEDFYDSETAGHYFRRIRRVAFSLPSIAGPNTGVFARFSLIRSRIRTEGIAGGGREYEWEGPEDNRFRDHLGSMRTVMTSTAKSDDGLFPRSLNEDRYLPFEGAGAISEWTVVLPDELRRFDYNTIDDLEMYIEYTARDGGEALGSEATEALLGKAADGRLPYDAQFLSLHNDAPQEWNSFRQSEAEWAELAVPVKADQFPFWVKNRVSSIDRIHVFARSPAETITVAENDDGSGAQDTLRSDPTMNGLLRGVLENLLATFGDNVFTTKTMYLDNNNIEELWVVVEWRSDE